MFVRVVASADCNWVVLFLFLRAVCLAFVLVVKALPDPQTVLFGWQVQQNRTALAFVVCLAAGSWEPYRYEAWYSLHFFLLFVFADSPAGGAHIVAFHPFRFVWQQPVWFVWQLLQFHAPVLVRAPFHIPVRVQFGLG